MRFPSLLPLALLTALTLSGCEKEDASPTDSTLLAYRWQLRQVDDFPLALSSYSETTKSYLEFVDLGHCTVGQGPCNKFSGRYTLSATPQELQLSPQIATRMACPALEIEARFLENLARTARYEISGEELRLYDGEQPTPRLLFQRVDK
ncbi:hypothetical protein GCM10023185_39060 [Hymenobacter saemangeumensis]|uniref:DUF306 domain-containing protein n=1 Tax=Hymenobacter saemangeumensis TaxID=1084522 RepID=A0ABP8IRK4_9BACT